jgi:hypothetical protein
MTTGIDHPLSRSFHNAGLGLFPQRDRGAEVGPALPGPCDAVAFFAGHLVVAADVTLDWVDGNLAEQILRDFDNPAAGIGHFLAALRDQLGTPPIYVSVLTVAPYRPAVLSGTLEDGGQVDLDWAAYRTEVRTYRYHSAVTSGALAIGRGPGERWDVCIHLDQHLGSQGQASQELLGAARTVVPDHGLLFGSAPLHDPGALRALLDGGFLPICTEALFLTRPQ